MTIDSILVSDDTQENTALTTVEDLGRKEVREQQATVDFKMVTFSLSGKDYAINIMHVKEIAKAGHFTYVPNVLPFVVGVYNLRGEIIPILDLRIFFNVQTERTDTNTLQNLLILNVSEQTFGIIVDKIDKVVGVQKSTIQPPHPLFSDVNVKYISGVVEYSKRLYILLDIETIFSKETFEASTVSNEKRNIQVKKAQLNEKKAVSQASVQASAAAPVSEGVNEASQKADVKASSEKTESPAPAPVEKEGFTQEDEKNFGFIKESLGNFKKFIVQDLNEAWIKFRFGQWKKEKPADKIQIQSDAEAGEFLKPFWSSCTDTWWTKEYAESVEKLLPENSAKNIIVWNPGCGKGTETYCLACVLAKRYPQSKIRIYAQDIDLLNVSNAPMLNVPDDVASGWIKPYLSKNASGKNVFNQEIKESIMFEYHDCLHTNALPMTDIIFARDLLSFIDKNMVKAVLSDFEEKLKGNGILVIGENEGLSDTSNFMENTIGSLTAYKKQ